MNFTVTVNIPRIDVHVHHADPDLTRRLDGLAAQLTHLRQQGARHMAVSEAIRAFAARLDAATTEIANDLKALRDKIAAGTPLTAEDQAELDRLAAQLEEMGKDPENPVPEPNPTPAPPEG